MAWNFNARNVEPLSGTANLPVGQHPVVIKSSAEVGTKSGGSGMLVFTLSVIDGPARGSQGVYRLNLWNASQTASEIAQKQLSAICHVTGVFDLAAEPKGSELFGRPFVVLVEQQKDSEYTHITAVLDMAGNPPVKGSGGQQQAQPQQAQPQAWSQHDPAGGPPNNGTNGGTQPSQAGQPAWAQQPQTSKPSWQR